jgi:hypothetical protein
MSAPHPAFAYALADGVAAFDIGPALKRHRRKRYETRAVADIRVALVHHSGVLGARGIQGAINSSRYAIAKGKLDPRTGKRRRKTEFPSLAYHFWIPWHLEHIDGYLTCYQAHPLDVRTWHSGGDANDVGVGICLQGNTTTVGMSEHQLMVLPALLDYLRADIDGLEIGWHSIADRWGGSPKPACPGKGAESWLAEYVATIA